MSNSPGTKGAATLDRAAVLDRVGGDESLLREIADIFLAEYPGLIDGIRAAIDAQDAQSLQEYAHTLKGSVSNFGATDATEAAFELEKLGRQQQLDGTREALRALELHFSALEPALRAILSD